MAHRVGSAEAGVRMPPIARSVVHGEGSALINQWIQTGLAQVDAENENEIQNENNCSDSEIPLLITEILPVEITDGLSELQAATGGLVTLKDLTDLLAVITGGVTDAASSATQLLERTLKGLPLP